MARDLLMPCNTGYLFNNDRTDNGYSLLTTSCILNFYQVTSVMMTVVTSGNLLGIQVGWTSHLQQKNCLF